MLLEELKELKAEQNRRAAMSSWERRRYRMISAQARLFGVDAEGKPLLDGIAEVIGKSRNGIPLTDDEFVVVNLGFLPGEPQ